MEIYLVCYVGINTLFIYKLRYNYTTFFNKSQGLATENYLGKLDFIYPKTGRDELLEVTLI